MQSVSLPPSGSSEQENFPSVQAVRPKRAKQAIGEKDGNAASQSRNGGGTRKGIHFTEPIVSTITDSLY